MKKFEKRPRPDEATGTRTGPRARAAQERRFSDPYSRAERPAGAGRPDRGERSADRPEAARAAVIRLDPDVARVFRDSETVNEVLRMVMRLARFGAGRPTYDRDRKPPAFGERRAPPRGERPPPRGERPPPRGERTPGRRPPPRARAPRFKEE